MSAIEQGSDVGRPGRQYRFIQASLWMMAVSGLFESALALYEAAQGRYGPDLVAMPFMLHFGVAALWVNLIVLPRIRRYQLRYEAVLRSDTSLAPLAISQPQPDPTALALPATIRLRSRWPVNAILIAMIALVLAANYVSWAEHSPFLGAALGDAGLWVVSLFVAVAISGSQVIIVTDEGLCVRRGRNINSIIEWEDVRLFAIVGSGKHHLNSIVYLLGAPKLPEVRWARICRISWYSLSEPTIPFDNYDWQMEALLSLIAARTGLPLYDLR